MCVPGRKYISFRFYDLNVSWLLKCDISDLLLIMGLKYAVWMQQPIAAITHRVTPLMEVQRISCIEHSGLIKVCDGITLVFYPGLSHRCNLTNMLLSLNLHKYHDECTLGVKYSSSKSLTSLSIKSLPQASNLEEAVDTTYSPTWDVRMAHFWNYHTPHVCAVVTSFGGQLHGVSS